MLGCRLAVVALGPLGQDACALVAHFGQVNLGHGCVGAGRVVRGGGVHARIAHDGVVLAVQLIGFLADGEISQFLGCRQVLGALDDGRGFHVPGCAFLGQDHINGGAGGLFFGAAHVKADADHPLTFGCLNAGGRSRMGVDRDVLVQLVHELPGSFLAHDLDPGIHRLVAST